MKYRHDKNISENFIGKLEDCEKQYDCIALDFSADIDTHTRWQDKNGEWHTWKYKYESEGEE